LLAHGWWLSPASSTTKTGHHDIAEILLKVALNTINQSNHHSRMAYGEIFKLKSTHTFITDKVLKTIYEVLYYQT